MDTNQLRSWLGLPPGPWPPDDRTLLGLPAGPVDAADAERRALALMGRLRPHQLVNPELVTEGMNRLAQALLAVTATASGPPRPAPAAAASVPVTPAVGLEPPPVAVSLEPEPSAPTVLEPDVVEVPVVAAPPPPTTAPTPPQADTAKRPSSPRASPPRLPDYATPTPIPIGPRPEDRRAAYRELAGLRGLIRAWDQLRATLADPSATLATPGEVFELLEGIRVVRSAAIHPGLDPGTVRDVSPVIASLIRQPLPLAVFRSMVPSQRVTLAREWAEARVKFAARAVALRKGVMQAVPTRPTVTAAGIVHTMIRIPEWGLIVASGVVLAAAVVRLVTR